MLPLVCCRPNVLTEAGPWIPGRPQTWARGFYSRFYGNKSFVACIISGLG